uniref:Cnd3 domain-containing protein n=1 Tax=Caenorhabditis japonica TaxID=281687 RepID=A0A8R1HKF3_CAEJA
MPPKKRFRGPKLATVREELPTSSAQIEEDQLENEEFNNERGEPATERDDVAMLDSQTTKDMALAETNAKKRKSFAEKFCQEIDIRLSMMFEEVSVVEHRARVFKMIALATIEIFKEENMDENGGEGGIKALRNDDILVKFLLNFLEMWAKSTNVAARINTNTFINYFFETGADKIPKSADAFCGFSLQVSEKLYCLLTNSLRDREHTARVSAIRGLGLLQKHPIPSNWSDEAKSMSPRELLMRSFRDSAWECRLAAIEEFNPREGDIPILSDIIQFDKSLKVRLAALEKFGDCRPNKHVREKVEVVDLSLKDHEVVVRDMGKKVLRKWVKKLAEKWSDGQKSKSNDDVIETDVNDCPMEFTENKSKGFILAGAALVLLWLSDVPETVESHAILKRICQHLLDVIRHMYHCHQEPVNAFADVIMNDLRGDGIDYAVPIITKSTIGGILEASELATSADISTNRAMVFFWRCIIEYMVDRKRTEGDKMGALMRFVAPLKTMVEHFQNILEKLKYLEDKRNTFDEENQTDVIYVLEMSLVENFLLVMRHAHSEQAGLDAYRELLVSMLTNCCYQKKVVDLIVIELSQFYTDCPEDFLSLVYAKMNQLRQKFRNGKIPQLEGTVLVGEAKIVEKCEEDGKSAAQIMELHNLMVINSVLKTGILKEWANEYHDRYGKVFQRNIVSADLDSRVLALECIGIIGMYDLNKSKKILGEVIQNFKNEKEPVLGTLITVLTDLTIEHGMDQVDVIMAKNSKDKSLLSLLTDIIVSEEPGRVSHLLLESVEGLAKILLHLKVDPYSQLWQRAMVSLMFRASYAITDRFSARIRSTIIVMLQFFCSLKKTNQLLVVKSFHKFFEMWAFTSNISYLAPNPIEMIPRLKRCAAAFVSLTRHSVLNPEERNKNQPTHVTLVDDILYELVSNPDSTSVDFYLHALYSIEYESFTRTELNKIYGDLEPYIAVHDADDDKHRFNELRRVQKKIAKMLGINLYSNEEENADEMTTAPPTRNESRAASYRVKKAPSVATVIEEQEEEMEENPEDPSTFSKRAPTPARRGRAPRSQPSSAQKKKKEEDALNILSSPQRNPRRPPSRQNTGSRPTAAPTSAVRTAPPRSSRRLRSDK